MAQKVLIIGGTGLTGKEIVKALVKDKDIEITCLTRPPTPKNPTSPFLTSLQIPLLPLDLSTTTPLSTLTTALSPFPTIISCLGFSSHVTELRLIDALAGLPLTRFIPCSWATPCPSGDIMLLRDEKQRVFERVWQYKIPYTIVDVGFWYQISLPRVASGKLDGLIVLDAGDKFGDGKAENLLIDKRDIGGFVGEIVKDAGTVGKWVVCWGERIDQEGVFRVVGEESGEVVEVRDVSFLFPFILLFFTGKFDRVVGCVREAEWREKKLTHAFHPRSPTKV
ncbi:unnamed protein product [Periconia digitata]|uniref:NmrA-like domain-containing protein n=1 Tax=Periconia digitata TaxID=1303443 RepID=A0A9W4UCL4_9PLEO|nr:unnamed protein product [Periconia digitata]